MLVHRVVAITYLENRNNLPQVGHLNSNKVDNRVQNLEWCNQSMNEKVKIESNRSPRTFKFGDILEMHQLYKSGVPPISIAKKFNVGRGFVSKILKGIYYKYPELPPNVVERSAHKKITHRKFLKDLLSGGDFTTLRKAYGIPKTTAHRLRRNLI